MGYFSRAKAITKSDTINPLPAWEFMNQTGTLGTNLKGSLIYVGGAGDVNVIPAGTEGAQNTVVALTVSDGGSGYTAANNVAIARQIVNSVFFIVFKLIIYILTFEECHRFYLDQDQQKAYLILPICQK